jgi:hypothetical protein
MIVDAEDAEDGEGEGKQLLLEEEEVVVVVVPQSMGEVERLLPITTSSDDDAMSM